MPIKRHHSLANFSREHHHGLLLVWKIREELRRETDAGKIKDYLLYFFRDFLLAHFRQEEEFLFSLLGKEDVLRLRAEQEHREIYSLVSAIENAGEEVHTLLSRFAALLEQHIRFEERELFNHLEKQIDPSMLEAVTANIETRLPSKSEWQEEFETHLSR